jgi:hypothetical protein
MSLTRPAKVRICSRLSLEVFRTFERHFVDLRQLDDVTAEDCVDVAVATLATCLHTTLRRVMDRDDAACFLAQLAADMAAGTFDDQPAGAA